MIKKKISIPKKAKQRKKNTQWSEIEWLDICSDSSWQSIDNLKLAKLPVCVTKGHLLSRIKVSQECLAIILRLKKERLKRLVILQ